MSILWQHVRVSRPKHIFVVFMLILGFKIGFGAIHCRRGQMITQHGCVSHLVDVLRARVHVPMSKRETPFHEKHVFLEPVKEANVTVGQLTVRFAKESFLNLDPIYILGSKMSLGMSISHVAFEMFFGEAFDWIMRHPAIIFFFPIRNERVDGSRFLEPLVSIPDQGSELMNELPREHAPSSLHDGKELYDKHD